MRYVCDKVLLEVPKVRGLPEWAQRCWCPDRWLHRWECSAPPEEEDWEETVRRKSWFTLWTPNRKHITRVTAYCSCHQQVNSVSREQLMTNWLIVAALDNNDVLHCDDSFPGFRREADSQLLVMRNQIRAGLKERQKQRWSNNSLNLIHRLIRDYWVLNSACTLISGASSKAGFPGFSDAANELASLKTVSNQPPSLPVTSHWPQRGPPLSCEVFQRCIWWVPTLCRLPLVHTAPPAGSAHWPRPARDRTTPRANQLLWSSEENMGSARYESHKEYHSWLISVLTISSARAYFIT